MIAEDIGANPHIRAFAELITPHHLTVLQNMPCARPRVLASCRLNCCNRDFGCLVSICVNMHLNALLLHFLTKRKDGFRWRVPDSVWLPTHISGPLHTCGPALNGAVRHELYSAKAELLMAVLLKLQRFLRDLFRAATDRAKRWHKPDRKAGFARNTHKCPQIIRLDGGK